MNNGFNLIGRRGLSFLVVILSFLSVYGACKGYMYVRAYVHKYYFIVCGVVCVCVCVCRYVWTKEQRQG